MARCSSPAKRAYRAETWRRAVGFGGISAVRRGVGWAKVSDIQSLEPDPRARAAGTVLTAARRWITERHGLDGPSALAEATEEAVAAWR